VTYSEQIVVVDAVVGKRPFPSPLERCGVDSSSVLARSDALSRGGSHIFIYSLIYLTKYYNFHLLKFGCVIQTAVFVLTQLLRLTDGAGTSLSFIDCVRSAVAAVLRRCHPVKAVEVLS